METLTTQRLVQLYFPVMPSKLISNTNWIAEKSRKIGVPATGNKASFCSTSILHLIFNFRAYGTLMPGVFPTEIYGTEMFEVNGNLLTKVLDVVKHVKLKDVAIAAATST